MPGLGQVKMIGFDCICLTRQVTDSVNQLLNTFMQSAPGQKECDNALRNIQTIKSMLDNINEPINDWTYFECLEAIMAKSKVDSSI